MSIAQAREFLNLCFEPGDTIAVLLRGETVPLVRQRTVRCEQALAHRYLGWLQHENKSGANVYVAANPLVPGSRRRTKECIAEIRHLYLDVDCDGDARLSALIASDQVPSPSIIVSTSPGKYQVLWRVEGFSFEQQETMLKLLAIRFGGDSACTDCNRVIRVPGFSNRKYTPTHPVTAEYLRDSVSHPDHFQLWDGSPNIVLPLSGIAQPQTAGKHTHSEQDWSWVLSALSVGKDPAQLTDELALLRADKPNPRYYAERTVDMASARLALLAGSSVQDVVSMLEECRRSELPASLCSARAREIAHTAARMIARRQTA